MSSKIAPITVARNLAEIAEADWKLDRPDVPETTQLGILFALIAIAEELAQIRVQS